MGIQKNTFTWPFFCRRNMQWQSEEGVGGTMAKPKAGLVGLHGNRHVLHWQSMARKNPQLSMEISMGKSHYKWGEFSKLPRFFVPEGMMGMCSSTHEKICLWTQIWFCSYMKTLEPRSSMRIQLMSRTEFARYLPQFQQWQDNMFGHLANIVELDVFLNS